MARGAPGRRFASLADQRGIALPMALIALVVLSALALAFSVLAQSEPLIAANHARSALARALAESGVERAIWALSTGALAPPASGTAAAPYDGNTYLAVSRRGGFTVAVTAGQSPSVVEVRAVGWHPSNAPGATRARRTIRADLERIPDLAKDAPCALCINGAMSLSGAAAIDAQASFGSDCGNKYGTVSAGLTDIEGSTAAIVGGQFPASSGNQALIDYSEATNPFNPSFGGFTLSADELRTLKTLARNAETYYTGSLTFSASNQLPAEGIVFVDTANGDLVSAATPEDGVPHVHLGGAATGGVFRGWLVVNGDLTIAGSFGIIEGLVYVLNRLRQTGAGTGGIHGLVIAHEVRGQPGTAFSSGNANITYDCAAARGGGAVPTGWFLKSGSYQEVSD
jgi:Tfp pilus assembly protein PilV